MKKAKQAFSLVELIIAISIIVILSSIAITSMEGAKDKSNNSKIISDVGTLNNSFKSYLEETKDLPEPKGNLQFYGEDTGYRHSYDDAFGVSGYVTQEVLPAKYMNNLPLDPKTGQYYGYARTKNTLHFEIAGVIFENNNPKAKVSGNWTGEYGPYNLVKEYAGPNFVYDSGTDYFPYNPYEKMLVAKVSSYTGGILKINGNTLSDEEILNYNLGEGDKVSISSGGTANLYFSDGSNSVLGDTSTGSEVVLTKMKYVEDTNLATSIKLALNVGSLWTKASKLSDKSDFEIYTTDAVAAVRGTIFGLRKDGTSNIVVAQGRVKVERKTPTGVSPIYPPTTSTDSPITTVSSALGGVAAESYINVESGSGSKGVENASAGGGNYVSSTGALSHLPDESSQIIIENIAELNQNQQIELESIVKPSLSRIAVTFALNPSFQKAHYLKLTKDTNIYKRFNTGSTSWTSSSSLLLNSGSMFLSSTDSSVSFSGILSLSGINNIQLAFCNQKNQKERCSRELSISLKDNVSFDIDTKEIESCEKHIDEIYQKLFQKKINKSECDGLLGIKEWSKKSKADKEMIIRKRMSGKDCLAYQKNFGPLTGTGYSFCKPNFIKIGGEKKVENLLAGQGYDLVVYAGYDNYKAANPTETLAFKKVGGGDIDPESLNSINYGRPVWTGSIFKDNITNGDSTFIGRTLTGNIPYNFTKNGVFSLGKTKGIFLDNHDNAHTSNQDYLKYEIDDLGLTSTGTFAIEMSVRGAALKRDAGTYTLFQLGDVKIRLFPGVIRYSFGSTNYNLLYIPSNLGNNKFYKVVVQFTNGKIIVSLYDKNTLLKSDENDISSTTPSYDHLYIGSKKNDDIYTEQWNDIIDYVKIYKRPELTNADIAELIGVSETEITTEITTEVNKKSHLKPSYIRKDNHGNIRVK